MKIKRICAYWPAGWCAVSSTNWKWNEDYKGREGRTWWKSKKWNMLKEAELLKIEKWQEKDNRKGCCRKKHLYLCHIIKLIVFKCHFNIHYHVFMAFVIIYFIGVCFVPVMFWHCISQVISFVVLKMFFYFCMFMVFWDANCPEKRTDWQNWGPYLFLHTVIKSQHGHQYWID